MFSGLPRSQGTLWNQLESKMTSEGTLGTSNTAKKVIFKGDGSLDDFFSRLWEKFNVFCTSKESDAGLLRKIFGK